MRTGRLHHSSSSCTFSLHLWMIRDQMSCTGDDSKVSIQFSFGEMIFPTSKCFQSSAAQIQNYRKSLHFAHHQLRPSVATWRHLAFENRLDADEGRLIQGKSWTRVEIRGKELGSFPLTSVSRSDTLLSSVLSPPLLKAKIILSSSAGKD